MKVLNQSHIAYRPPNVVGFKANNRNVWNALGDTINNNFTMFFRYDMGWDKLIDDVEKKYARTSKVNIYDFACSGGEEAFSWIMFLSKKLGDKKAQKFFPIIASDIDSEILKNPKQGVIKPSKDDIIWIKRFMGDDYSRFMEFDSKFEFDEELNMDVCTGKIRPILQDKVVFRQADARKTISQIEPDNSIVMCRNFWPYLDKEDQLKLAKDISDRLGRNSMCVIGSFDTDDSNVIQMFKDQGLRQVFDSSFCYEKTPFLAGREYLNNPQYLMNTYAGAKYI
jgi:chemotaxis methyl-accepting protein methylase